MKKLFLLLIILATTSSCIYGYGGDDDFVPYTTQYEPVTEVRSVFNQRIRLTNGTPQIMAGKIYIKDQYLFIVDPGLGIHVYDNIDRSTPLNIAFIEVIGITDLSIKNDLIYVHHLQDLAILRYSPQQSTLLLVEVVPNVFPKLETPDGFSGDYFNIPDDQVIIGYQAI